MGVEVLVVGGEDTVAVVHRRTSPSVAVRAIGTFNQVRSVYRVGFAGIIHECQQVGQLQLGQSVVGFDELLVSAFAIFKHTLHTAEVYARETLFSLCDGHFQFCIGKCHHTVGVIQSIYADGLLADIEGDIVCTYGYAPVAVTIVSVTIVVHTGKKIQVGHAAAVSAFVVGGCETSPYAEVAIAVGALFQGNLPCVDTFSLMLEACLGTCLRILAQYLPAAILYLSVHDDFVQEGRLDGFEAYAHVFLIQIHHVTSAYTLERVAHTTSQGHPVGTAGSDETSCAGGTREGTSAVVLVEEHIHAVSPSPF